MNKLPVISPFWINRKHPRFHKGLWLFPGWINYRYFQLRDGWRAGVGYSSSHCVLHSHRLHQNHTAQCKQRTRKREASGKKTIIIIKIIIISNVSCWISSWFILFRLLWNETSPWHRHGHVSFSIYFKSLPPPQKHSLDMKHHFVPHEIWREASWIVNRLA